MTSSCVYQAGESRSNDQKRSPASNSNSNGVVGVPGPLSEANSNTAMANRLSPSRSRRIDEMRNQAPDPNAPKPDIELILKGSTRPAPENSEFSVALTDILIERRVFKSHPQLAKAEKVTEGTSKRLIVWLRDGRMLEAPGDKVEGLSTVTSAAILGAVGIDAARSQPIQPVKPKNDPGRKPID